MSIENEYEAFLYIESKGDVAVADELSAGKFGGNKRDIYYLTKVLKEREERNREAVVISNASLAAISSFKSAKMAQVTAAIALFSLLIPLLLSVMFGRKSDGEQMAQCRVQLPIELKAKNLTDERADYYEDCMRAAGFEFKTDGANACLANDEITRSVKKVMASCYRPTSIWRRISYWVKYG